MFSGAVAMLMALGCCTGCGVNTIYQDNLQPAQESVFAEQSKIYHVDSGDTLAEVAETLRNQDYETVVGFSKGGMKLFDCTSYGETSSYTTTTIRDQFAENGGVLVVHNHPEEGSFSAVDLYTEASLGTRRLMVISPDYVYTLDFGAMQGKIAPEKLQKFYLQSTAERSAEIETYIDNLNGTFTRKEIAAMPAPEDTESVDGYCLNAIQTYLRENYHSKVSINTGIWITHQAMLDTAEEFNLAYERTPYDEFDFTSEELFAE